MIKACIAFPTLGNVYSRLMKSINYYLPDDIRIVEVIDTATKCTHPDHDILVTYNGNGSYYPQNAFISPKAVISERADVITLSHFTKKDVLFTYNSTDVDRLADSVCNVCLWPRPVDPRLFYPDSYVRDILVMSAGHHGMESHLQRVDDIVSRLGAKHLVMMHPSERSLDLKAAYDYCFAIVDDDNNRMRQNYSSAMYTMSLCPDYKMPNQNQIPDAPTIWSCGLETSVIEGLFCGSVPLVLRSKHTDYMHKWLDGLAVWIDPDNFDEEIEAILAGQYTPITKEQQAIALERFGAENVWKIFWDAIRKVL